MIGWNASNAATTGTTTDMTPDSATEMGIATAIGTGTVIEVAIADAPIAVTQAVWPSKGAMLPDWTGVGTTHAIADASIRITRATIAMETAATARSTAAKKRTARPIALHFVAATRSDTVRPPATAAGNKPTGK